MTETIISAILRIGVLLSIALITFGVTVTFVHHHDYFSSRPALGQLIDAHQNYTASLGAVLQGTREMRGQSIIMLGVLVLIATPVLRVAASIALFFAEHDAPYVAITSVVLLLLLLSFMIGAAE
ncbi:MAG TPA: DUF1634 domain-containing protein [Thermoanaerobaculia bacterium]|nr:DUF1634 domain-containing protein [Thermoanaerobaculia bacterium]